jgi:hypothetical protein
LKGRKEGELTTEDTEYTEEKKVRRGKRVGGGG